MTYVVTCSLGYRERFVFGRDNVNFIVPTRSNARYFKQFRTLDGAKKFAKYFNYYGFEEGIRYCKVEEFETYYRKLKS